MNPSAMGTDRLQRGVSLGRRLLRSDLIRKVAETFATRFVVLLVGIVSSVLVTRSLGPEGRGVYVLAVAVCAMGVQFGNLGLHASNTYYVAQDRSLLPGLFANTLLVSLGFGTLLSLGIGAFCLLFPNHAPLQGVPLFLAVLWIPFGLGCMLMQNLLIGIDQVRVTNRVDLMTKVSAVALIGLVLLTKRSSVATMLIATQCAFLFAFVALLRSLWRSLDAPPRFSSSLFRANLHYGSKAYVAALLAYLALRINVFLVERYCGKEQVGYYSVALTLADMLTMLPSVLGTLLFPRLTAQTDPKTRLAQTRQAALGIGGIVAALSVAIGLGSAWIIRTLYGEAFLGAVPALNWLLPGVVALAMNIVLMNYFASLGMPLVTIYSPGLAVLLNLALNVLLLPRIGIAGAAVASTASYVLMLSCSLIYLTWRSRRGLE